MKTMNKLPIILTLLVFKPYPIWRAFWITIIVIYIAKVDMTWMFHSCSLFEYKVSSLIDCISRMIKIQKSTQKRSPIISLIIFEKRDWRRLRNIENLWPWALLMLLLKLWLSGYISTSTISIDWKSGAYLNRSLAFRSPRYSKF